MFFDRECSVTRPVLLSSLSALFVAEVQNGEDGLEELALATKGLALAAEGPDPQQAGKRLGDGLLGRLAFLDGLIELGDGVRAAAFLVETGVKRQGRRVLHCLCETVSEENVRPRIIVRDDKTVKLPLIPEDLVQEPVVATCLKVMAVRIIIGVDMEMENLHTGTPFTLL